MCFGGDGGWGGGYFLVRLLTGRGSVVSSCSCRSARISSLSLTFPSRTQPRRPIMHRLFNLVHLSVSISWLPHEKVMVLLRKKGQVVSWHASFMIPGFSFLWDLSARQKSNLADGDEGGIRPRAAGHCPTAFEMARTFFGEGNPRAGRVRSRPGGHYLSGGERSLTRS